MRATEALIWLYLVSFLIFNVKKYCNLDIPIKGESRSLKVVPLDRLGTVSFYCSIITLSQRYRDIFEIFNFKNAVTLKTGLWVPQGH